MTQRNIAAWLAQWLAQSPAQSVEDWHNRKGWLASIPCQGSGVLLTL